MDCADWQDWEKTTRPRELLQEWSELCYGTYRSTPFLRTSFIALETHRLSQGVQGYSIRGEG